MLARLATAALVGLTAHPVGVEVDIGRGLPAVTVVGLGGTAVLEARDRLRAAFGNTGYEWPDRRITVSLPPADLPKQGSGFDLPVASAVLIGRTGEGLAGGRSLNPQRPPSVRTGLSPPYRLARTV
jgi:magnesium chelatase family protein